MSKPIVIIGGGIAGIAAASELRRAGAEPLLLEAERTLGGRLTSLSGDGWRADVTAPYFSQTDTALWSLVRESGLMVEANVLGDILKRIAPDNRLASHNKPFDSRRVALRSGWSSFFHWWTRYLRIRYGARIDAVRWDKEENAFLLRDAVTKKPYQGPDRRDLHAKAVLLAVPGPQAAAIAANSAVLEPVRAPLAQAVGYAPRVVGVFLCDAVDPGFYGAEGEEGANLEWLAFEERKGGIGQAPAGSSLVVARASRALSERLFGASEDEVLARLWSECRALVPALPEKRQEAHALRWKAAYPRKEALIQIGASGLPTRPEGAAIDIAGDYAGGGSDAGAAQSGLEAAQRLIGRLKAQGESFR
ncbi:MAG: FAD-dependent oxidoreductase [Sumerlaeia bacterium]